MDESTEFVEPVEGPSQMVTMRMPTDLFNRIMAFRSRVKRSRSNAICFLLEQGLLIETDPRVAQALKLAGKR